MVKGLRKVINRGSISPFCFVAWVAICFCSFTINTWAQNDVAILEEANKQSTEWQNQFWVYLETSEHAQFRTYAAIRLLHSGVSESEARGDPRNHVYVSAASAWEISINKALGKLTAPDDIDVIVEERGFEKLPISLFHGDQAEALPDHHKDPFDRMLVAQAQSEGLVLVTSDEKMSRYGVRTMKARK